MNYIPSLTHQQLELLRLAKKNSVEELQLCYEFPVLDESKPPASHPSFIQELINEQLIQVQVKSTSLSASEYQRLSWQDFCEGLGHPSQADWDLWRNGFLVQQEGFDYLMIPGKDLEEFSQVWIREISLQAVEPSSP